MSGVSLLELDKNSAVYVLKNDMPQGDQSSEQNMFVQQLGYARRIWREEHFYSGRVFLIIAILIVCLNCPTDNRPMTIMLNI